MNNWVEVKREFKGQRGEGIYKDSSILNLMQKIKIEWKMETVIAPLNKHQFPSNN
jgi:hypothetical protein